ncbi:hypothetical protein L195_g059931 [Trifolium pratense]|uniref:Uncharacterized protein n=1 Tax=Trifolium pratense TaxID=57577 RepID=A0A2K3K121_TRIPR|nr:hypothetical protein L195_g059931 [Trifolium pratense]
MESGSGRLRLEDEDRNNLPYRDWIWICNDDEMKCSGYATAVVATRIASIRTSSTLCSL